uniref:Uncharacterized protein n=1 Tax=Ascaris lumbricoides TaxID=6252 RepID=A0A0M3IW68_ASCLU
MGLNGLDRRTVYGNHSSAESAGENHENGDVRMRVKKNTATFTQNERTKQPESKRTTTIRFRPQSTVSFASIGNRLFLKSLISYIILPTIFFIHKYFLFNTAK